MDRIPAESTPRYVQWANTLSHEQLSKQIYTCFGPTILMPTWFCHRSVFDSVGGFDQSKPRGLPEDLIFFYKHLQLGGSISRVDEVLLTYRYHPEATTFSVKDETIWRIRLQELEKNVLPKWTTFTIWNAGKEGRRFYRSLSTQNRSKVVAFCDVDKKKIDKGWYVYEMDCAGDHQAGDDPSSVKKMRKDKPHVPIVHYSQMEPPVVICVKLGLTGGQFEQILSSLNLIEGENYVHFG